MMIALLAATVLMADSAAALQAAPAAAAPTPAATATPNAKPAQADGNKLVCRNEPTLGSRLPTKKCSTAAEIAQRRLEDRANLEKLQVAPTGRTN
jgi:hypothetical protein